MSGGYPVVDYAAHPGQDATYDKTWGGHLAGFKKALTASGSVKAAQGIYYGYVVTTVTSAAITLYDNATTNSGTVIDVIPASATGTRGTLNVAIPCDNGIWAQFAGTGTVLFLYD